MLTLEVHGISLYQSLPNKVYWGRIYNLKSHLQEIPLFRQIYLLNVSPHNSEVYKQSMVYAMMLLLCPFSVLCTNFKPKHEIFFEHCAKYCLMMPLLGVSWKQGALPILMVILPWGHTITTEFTTTDFKHISKYCSEFSFRFNSLKYTVLELERWLRS